HLVDRIADHVDPLAFDPFPDEITIASMRIGKQHCARVVNDTPVNLLWHSVVETTVAGLHVEDRYGHPFSENRNQAAIRVAEYQDPVRALLPEDLLRPCKDLADLLPERVGSNTKPMVRRPHRELLEEQVT